MVVGVRVFCSDAFGNLRVPASPECFYIAPLILGAFFLLYPDWKKTNRR
jgi:hypothetical protein